MSTALALLAKGWPYILCAIVAGYLTHHFDSGSYARLELQKAQEESQWAEERVKAQKASQDALEAQVKARLNAEAHNSQVIDELQKRVDTSVADAALAHRLLIAARQAVAAAGSPVLEAGDQPGATPAGTAPGNGPIGAALADTFTECKRNSAQLNALIQQIQPQL